MTETAAESPMEVDHGGSDITGQQQAPPQPTLQANPPSRDGQNGIRKIVGSTVRHLQVQIRMEFAKIEVKDGAQENLEPLIRRVLTLMKEKEPELVLYD